jgi:hypothetical protein
MGLPLNSNTSNVRSHGELVEYTPELFAEYIRCKEDIVYFAEKYFTIVSLDKGKIKIKLFDYQKKMLKSMIDPPDGKQHTIILSARQSGKTTTYTVYLLWYTLFNEDKSVAILANKEATSINIMKRVKLAYEKLPKFLQQGISQGGWNKKTIEFENGSVIFCAATSSSAIRSMSVTTLLIDEFAFVPDNIADEFMSSVYPTIISGKTTRIIITSTYNGMNHFYHLYQDAKHGRNSFYAIEVKWNQTPGRDEAWKVKVIKDVGIRKWMQEFDNKAVGSCSSLIDSDILSAIRESEPIEMKYGGAFLIYEQPIKGETYILGVDTGKGIGKDYSVIQVIKIGGIDQIKQVAVYANNRLDPHNFAPIVVDISEFYNNAHIMAENNGKEGGILVEAIWWECKCDRLVNMSDKDLGIPSNTKSKFVGNMNIRRYMDHNYLEIVDKTTVDELTKYSEVKPNVFKVESDKGHDDHVTSLLWALYFIEVLDKLDIVFDVNKKVIKNEKSENSTNFGESLLISDEIEEKDDGVEILDRGWNIEDGFDKMSEIEIEPGQRWPFEE